MIHRLLLAAVCAGLPFLPSGAAACGNSPYRNEVSVTVRRILFQGPTTASRSEQQAIAQKIRAHFQSLCRGQQQWQPDVAKEAGEIAGTWYQDRGYFKLLIKAETIVIAAGETARTIDFRFDPIEKGQSYRLGEITWRGMRVFSQAELGRTMPIHPGEVFSRKKVFEGLENLRSLYVSHGYLDFTSIPNTSFNEEDATAYMDIDGYEGSQFHFRNLSVTGLDDDRTRRWQALWDQEMQGRPSSRSDLRGFLKQLFRPAIPRVDPLSVVSWNPDGRNAAVDVSMTFYSKSAHDAMQIAFSHR